MFPSRSFLVPGRICKSLMHPKLIFVYGVRQRSIISFLSPFVCGGPVFPPFVKETVLSPAYIVCSFVK